MRQILTASINLYVNASTGNDTTGDGSVTNPWATLQYAHDTVQNTYDLAGYGVIFNCQGAFTAGLNESGTLVGQNNPSNQMYIFSNGSSVASTGNAFVSSYGSGYSIQSTGTVTITAGSVGINASSGSTIVLNAGIKLGACGSTQIETAWGGNIYINNNICFSGGAQQCVYASGGVIQFNPGISSTWTVPCTYSNCYLWAYAGGVVGINGQTFTGTVIGIKYKAGFNGIIATGTGNINYLPGNSAGGVYLGGQYY